MKFINTNIKDITINKQTILQNIKFSLNKNEIMCILGQNGSGKSTLLKSILGIVNFNGDVFIDNKNINLLNYKQRAELLAYVPQNEKIPFQYTLLEVVLMGRFHHSSFYYTKNDRKIALEILEKFNISHMQNKSFLKLSGGQQQLGLIARAIAQDSEIIILDEPVSALDISHSFKLLDLISHLQKTIIITTHHPEQCFLADKILMIKNRKILQFGSHDILNIKNINELYDIKSDMVILPNKGKYFCVEE